MDVAVGLLDAAVGIVGAAVATGALAGFCDVGFCALVAGLVVLVKGAVSLLLNFICCLADSVLEVEITAASLTFGLTSGEPDGAMAKIKYSIAAATVATVLRTALLLMRII